MHKTLIAAFLILSTSVAFAHPRGWGYPQHHHHYRSYDYRYHGDSAAPIIGFGLGILGGLAINSYVNSREDGKCQKVVGYDVNKNPITKTVNCADLN